MGSTGDRNTMLTGVWGPCAWASFFSTDPSFISFSLFPNGLNVSIFFLFRSLSGSLCIFLCVHTSPCPLCCFLSVFLSPDLCPGAGLPLFPHAILHGAASLSSSLSLCVTVSLVWVGNVDCDLGSYLPSWESAKLQNRFELPESCSLSLPRLGQSVLRTD